ncbi:hypothetical protein ACG7TL_007859 [Trametes sanguinea]
MIWRKVRAFTLAVAARAPRMNADLSSVRSRKVWRKCAGARRQARGSCRKSAAPAQDEAAPSQAGPAPKTTASKAKGKKAAAATSGNAKSLQKGKAVARATQDAETEEREEEEEEEEEDVEVDPEEGGNTGTQKGKKKAVSRAKTVAGDEEATTTQKTSRTRQKTVRDSEERAVKREPTDVKLGFDVKGMQEHEQSRSALAQRAAKMRLGYGTLNLIDSTPVKLHFGKWNNRPIEPLRVKEIVKQLLFKGLWDWESPIPVVVPRRFIKLDALQAHRPEGTRAPPIVFTDEARDQIIELAGGHHRQQALIEYRATLDKSRATLTSKIAQLSKRKASDETDEALATLRKRLAEVEGTLAQPMLWLTEVFAAEDVDNEMGQYLSMNDEMPNLKQTELERFWLSLSAIKDYNAKYLSTSGKKVVRAPIGTDAWEDHILSKVLAPQDQKRGFGALLKMPRAWDFVNLAGQLAHMRDGKHLKIDTLKKRLCPVTKGQSVTKTVTDSRTKQPVSVRPPDTAGGIWLDLLESVVEEMVFVAKSGDWPESTMPRLQNYVKYLGYSPKQRATTVAANVKRSYEDLYATFMKRGVVDDEVWHADLVKKIDEIYVQTVKPAMASLLRTSTPDWKAAMTAYWAQVDAAVAESWESMVPHCAWGPDTAATVKGAKERLMWVRRLRELGQGYDLPLATLTFIQDLYDHFASVSYGLQWISRQIDPMVDATVTSKYPWVWDHTSNMREFMINPHAVSNPNDQPRHFYLWLCEQMELVRGVDMMLASGIMKPEYEAVFSAPTNTFTNATTVIEDVLLNVVDHDEEPDEIVDDLKAIWNELYENIVPQSSLPKEDDLDMGLYHPRHRAFASPFNVSNKHRQAYPCLSLLLSSAVDFRGVIHRSNRKRFLGTLASRLHFTARIYKEIMEKTLVEPLAATLRNNLLQYLEKNRQRSISSMLKDMYVSAGIVKDGDKEIGAKLMWDVSLLRNVVPPQKQKTKLTVVDRDNFNKSVAKDARMKAYANDIKKIVKMVVGSTAAAAMPSGQGSKGVINGAVAEKLDELVEALSFNASRLEFRREGENTRKVYVMRDKDAVSFKVPSVEKRGDTRAYPSLDHFKSAEPKQWDLFVQLRERHVERLREKHTQSQASGSGKTSKIVVPRLDDIYPQDVRWPEVDQRIEDMESDVDPDELNFLSEGEGEGDAMDVDKGADESDTDDSGADDDAQDDDAQDDDAQDDDAQDDDAQDDDAQDDDAQDDDAHDGKAQDDEAHDGKAQDDEAHDGKAQDGGDTQGDQSGQASGAPGSGDLDPNAMPVDPTVSQSDVSMDVPMDGPNVPLTQIPPRPELSPEAERDAHAALVEAAAQGWDEDPGIALEDAFGTLDQLVAIREANQDLALPPPSRASLLKAIASYPELVEGRLDVLHFRPPPISEANFESYRAKLQARIAALPQDAPPSRKVEEVVRLVDSMVPRPAPEAEPTQPVAADPRKRSGRILEHARERHAAAEEQRKRRQTEQPGPSQRKSKKPRRDHRDRREDEMDSDFEGSQTRNDGLAFLSQEQDDFFFNAFDEDEAEAEEIALGEDGEGSDERALGEAAYDEEEDGVVPHGARVSEHVAPTMFTDDGIDQQEVTRSVEDAYGDQTRVAQMYETMPVRNIRLSTLREWYQGIEDTLAMHTLKQKNKIIIDKEFLVNTHDLNVSWTCAGTFLDYRQIVGRRAEMDVLLPNPHAPGAEADHRWNLTIAFEKRHWHFRGDLTALGCDMAGRMLHVGYTMAQEDIWLGLIPKEVYMNPPHVGDVKLEKKSTTMSPALSRAVIAGFLHVMERSGYRDVVLVQKYPDISCDAKFSWTFDIGERKRFEFNLTQMKRLAAAFREGWEEYYEAAPNHYRFKELEDSYPVFITLRYGQNRRLAFDDSLEAAAQTWDREVNYARVWRMSLALATHFKVRQWKEIPVDEILRAHPTVYDSYNPSSRRRIDDLDALPLLDDDGREIHIYSEDGFRVPRREPEAPRRGDRCAIMQNLPEVSSLFLGPASYDLEPDFDGELDEGRAHNIDEAQFDAEPERQDRHYRDTSYTVYPHFYSKTIGQWQATGVMHPLIPYVRQLCRRLTAPGAAGRAVVPLSSQCYNTSAHAMRVSKRFHVVQKGMLTGAATGPWATNARGKATASRLAGKVAAAFPHERITAQLRGDGGKKNSLRLENKFMLDLNHLREEYRNGDAIYRHFVLEHARMCERPPIIDALRRTSILFKYACFPEVYAWATLPVTALIEAVWNHHIKPTLDANNQPQAVRGTVSRKPQPQYVELIACLERVLNYAYTGAAQALPRQLMYGIWAGRSLLQTGFPMLWIGLSFTGESGAIPAVRVNLWPLDQETKRPLTASKCAQEITYGAPHYLGYETLFYMQSELSRMPADLWRDASLLGRQLRLLARIGQSVTKTVTDSRTKQPVSVRPPDTAGGIWLDLLESVVEEMVFVAKSGDWPESTMPRLQNYVKYLGYSPKQRATTVAANVKRSYEDLYATFMKRGVVDDEVWHADLVKKIDEIYVQTVKPAMASLLRTSTPDWKAAMTAYWAQVDAAVAESWESMVPHCAWGPDTAATVKGAKERLMWVRRLRELGQGYDLPLATLTFIQDLYDHFASVSYGLQWISRQIDPMVDATVTSKYPWVWDHTSNMREFMINPHAVSNPNDQPRHFYLWLCEQMELVRGVDMMLASGIMKPEYEAVFSAPTNTFTNATTVIEDVLLNVVDHDEEPDEIVDDLKAIWNELYENIVPQSSLPKEDDLDMGLYHPRHRAFASPFNVSNKHRQAYPCLSLLLSSAVDFRGVIHRSNRKRFLGTLASRLHFTADASNPPLMERENPAESLLKVEAGGRANADKGRGGEEVRKGIWIVWTLRVGIYKRESVATADALRKQYGNMPRRRAARANAFAPGALRSGGQCRARRARQGLARLSALPGSRKPLLEVVGVFADLRRSSPSSRVVARALGSLRAGLWGRIRRPVSSHEPESVAGVADARAQNAKTAGSGSNVLRVSLLAMQSTLENLDRRSVEVRNEVAALARAQVLQQLTVLEGLVDTNSRSREEWLEAQNELDYRMHAYLVLTYDTRDCELLSIATRIEMVLRRQTLDETFLVVERYRLFRTQREVSEAMYLAARERLRLLHDRAHAAVCVFSRAGPRYVTALARAEDLRSTVTSLEREVKRELASLAVGLEEAFREHEEQFPGFEPPQQMEEGEVRRDLEEAAEEMEAEGDAL